jgi:hypothetical protein
MGALGPALAAQQKEKERNQFYADSTKRMDSMKKQLDDISSMYKQQQERRAQRRASYGAATVGQQSGEVSGGTGLRISKGGMSPSARRRMRRAG